MALKIGMSAKGPSILSKKGFLQIVETEKMKFFETCIMDKQSKVKFSMSSHTT